MPEINTIGLGCDLCSVERIGKAIEKPHFVERIYTPAEQAYFMAKNRGRAQSAAAMFAAKEAVVKAMGTGFSGGIMPEQVEIVHDELGAPHARLSGEAEKRLAAMGGKGILLSLSHEDSMALAVAMITR